MTKLHRCVASLFALTIGCASETPRSVDTSVPRASGAGRVFDPGLIKVGDSVAGLRVAARAVSQATDGEWVGLVRFEGTVVVSGKAMAHPDAAVSAPCFEADSASAARLPRWSGDTRRAWFCFDNVREAVKLLGASAAAQAATVTVSDFTIHYARSDVVNSARLVRGERAVNP